MVRIVLWLLKQKLSVRDRALLMTGVLDTLGALPFKRILEVDPQTGAFLLNGKTVEYEQARTLQEGAKTLLKNPTFALLWEQVAYNAIGNGVHKAETIEQVAFARAALWWGQEERRILNELCG